MIKPIFITGAHKSGTSLLRSLLDGHHELFVIPFETHFLTNCGIQPIYPLRNTFQIDFGTATSFIDRTKKNIREYVTSISKFTDSTNFIIEEEVVNRHLEGINPEHDIKDKYRDFCEAIYRSIFQVNMQNRRVVEKSVENAEMAWIYQLLYPDSFFIHIIRNPYANLVSLRKFKTTRKSYPSIVEPLLSLYINYKFLELNQQFIKNYYVLKYEDLIMDPLTSMTNLSDFLDLEFDLSLLNPTSLGKPWVSNSVYGNQNREISTSNMIKWQNFIEPVEIYFINKLFRDFMLKYNYEFVKSRSFLKPAKNEYLKTYVRNRFFKLYLNNFA